MLATLIPNNCVWYVSPLKRAIQTSEALSKYVTYSKMVRENKLVEQNFGDWSGKKISEVWKILKKIKTKHNFSFINPDVSPPNGESFKEQSKRVGIWLENLNVSEGKSIVIISHAGTLRSILSHALKIKPDYAIGIEIMTKVGVDSKNHNGGCSILIGFKKKIESCQKSIKGPCCINKSLKMNPANIEPTANIINGTNITIGDSCMLDIG